MSANKSITERIFQAIGFELLAILICTPLLAWIMDKPMLDMGVVTMAIAALGPGLERGLQRIVRPCAQTLRPSCITRGYVLSMRCCSKAVWSRSVCR